VAVAFVNIASTPASPFTPAASTTISVPYPSSIVANNLLLLFVQNGFPAAFTTPSGWNLIQSNASVNVDEGVSGRLCELIS
jgi:hypothetical protein